MPEKSYTIAGTSVLDGVTTYRVANKNIKTRISKLNRSGHTEVDLLELPHPMTRNEARDYLVSLGRIAVMPTNRKDKPVELTAEQRAEAERVQKRERENTRKREARAKAKASKLAADDHNFVAGLTGDAKVEVPAMETEAEVEAVVAEPIDSNLAAEELLAIVDREHGVETERKLAGQGS